MQTQARRLAQVGLVREERQSLRGTPHVDRRVELEETPTAAHPSAAPTSPPSGVRPRVTARSAEDAASLEEEELLRALAFALGRDSQA